MITLIRHSHSMDRLPFISPVLWLDWAAVFSFVGQRFPVLGTLSAISGICLYCTCFWLSIGYGRLGYGTQQYEVLNIPAFCQNLNISWQTDPRRHHFVQLHSLIFGSATLGVLIAVIVFIDQYEDFRISDFSVAFKIYRGRSVNMNLSYFRSVLILQTVVAICVIAPAVVGVIVAAVINGHNFLILGQKGCYASFVSGRFSYVDLYWVEWRVKVATWIGLNT